LADHRGVYAAITLPVLADAAAALAWAIPVFVAMLSCSLILLCHEFRGLGFRATPLPVHAMQG